MPSSPLLDQIEKARAKGALPEAYAYAKTFLSQEPSHPDAHFLYAEMAWANEQFSEAEDALKAVLLHSLHHQKARVLLLRCLLAQKKFEDALPYMEDMFEAEQNQAAKREISRQIGALYLVLAEAAGDDVTKASACYEKAMMHGQSASDVRATMAQVLARAHKNEAAERAFLEALWQNPAHLPSLINLGLLHAMNARPFLAETFLQKALAHAPDSPEALGNLGMALSLQARYSEAVLVLQKALCFPKRQAAAEVTLGTALLALQRFAEGFSFFEVFRELGDLHRTILPKFNAPLWEGTPLEGKRLLVHMYELGFGDDLNLVSLLVLLRKKHPKAQLFLAARTPLLRLFQGITDALGISLIAGETIIGKTLALDFQVPLVSLLRLLQVRYEHLPLAVAYLSPRENLVAFWKKRLLLALSEKNIAQTQAKIGIVWASGELYRFHKTRTLSLEALRPILAIPNITWVSLQKGAGLNELATQEVTSNLVHFMDEATDFADTAAIAKNLDLVISVDTSVPHLVAAMGQPVWVLNRMDSDWRFLPATETNAWYPSMRVFHQQDYGVWTPVIEAVRDALLIWLQSEKGIENPYLLGSPESLAKEGMAFLKKGHTTLAKSLLEKAYCLAPDVAEVLTNLAEVYLAQGEPQRAQMHLVRALEKEPHNPQIRFNLSLCQLMQGKWQAGFQNYEARSLKQDLTSTRIPFDEPEWQGISSDLSGKTLLVYTEQGFGDNLQFVRFLKVLRARYPTATLCYIAEPPLFRLLRASLQKEGVQVFSKRDLHALPQMDCHLPVASLPYALGQTFSLADQSPYLFATPDTKVSWRQKLETVLPGAFFLRIGLVWKAGVDEPPYTFRNLPLCALAPLFVFPNIAWVSLQKDGTFDIAAEGLSEILMNPMTEVTDFADTAAIIENLDLVITVCTSVAHLAGGMGKPVWLLNRKASDWRWGLGSDRSEWYPSLRLFRQRHEGHWDTVVQALKQALIACYLEKKKP